MPELCSNLGKQHRTWCQVVLEILGMSRSQETCASDRLSWVTLLQPVQWACAGVGGGKLPTPPNQAWFPHSQGLASLEGWHGHWTCEWASAGLYTCKSRKPTLLTLPTGEALSLWFSDHTTWGGWGGVGREVREGGLDWLVCVSEACFCLDCSLGKLSLLNEKDFVIVF